MNESLDTLEAHCNHSTSTSTASAKKDFCPGGMAPSEWTHSVRAVRDTLVVYYSAPDVNTTHQVAYCPPIAASLFVLAVSVSYFKPSLWCCGQLWPYLRMGTLGMRLHQDCNAMGDAAKHSPRVPSICAQNAILCLHIIHIIWSRQIYVAIDNPLLVPSVSCRTTSTYLWNYVHSANDVSHAEYLQTKSCRVFSPLYKFRDGNQVNWVLRYCGECQG